MALADGTRLGPYEILSPLGAGGMGEVYRARDSKLGRDVAIKVLPQAFVSDAERVGRFQREAQLLAALNHPHIAAIFGLEESGGTRYLAMELVDGESLAERLRAGPLPVDDALTIAREIGGALAAAHEKGIVHRDLKPGNIMLTGDGRVKVLDFGLAKMIETEPAASGLSMSPTLSVQATLAGTILGTAAYMSPEQARGKPVDKRTDVWAFGCVFFEMLTARRAFQGDDTTETIAAVVRGEPDWAALPPGVPHEIEGTLKGCLAKDPRKRFADIAVPLFLLSGPRELTAAREVPTTSGSRWTRVLALAAVAVVTSTMAGGAAWTFWPSSVPPGVARFTVALPADQRFTNAGRQVVAMSPDGSRFVYVANSRLYVRAMDDLEAHVIPGSDAGVNVINPVFSPDGLEVAFFSEGQLKRLAIDGGAAVTICAASNPFGMSWGLDGIVFGQAKGIMRVSPNGGTPDVIVPAGPNEWIASPQTLPGGKGVLFTSRTATDAWDQSRIVVQLPDGQRKTLVDGGADGRYLPTGHLLYMLSGIALAVPFDPERLEVSGGAVPLIQGVSRSNSVAVFPGNPATHLSVAANGSLVYIPGPTTLDSDGAYDLALFDEKGGMQALGLRPATYQAPRVSRDGKSVAFVDESATETNVWIYDLASSSAARRLTFGGRNRAPVWSPDGVWIAYQSDREGDRAMFRQRADGSGNAERLTTPEKGTVHTPQSWSPDGAHLLVTVEKERAFTLWTMAIKDLKMSQFGDVRSAISPEGDFSPDGRWIVYQSREGQVEGSREVFVQPFPGTGAKYQVPPGNGGHPFWSRTGDRVIMNMTGATSEAVSFTSSPGVAFGVPVPFSRVARQEGNPATARRNVDAMRDGRVLGVTRAREESGLSNRITVVLNWFEELRSRVPVK